MAISGDTLLVGVPMQNFSQAPITTYRPPGAYVFVRDGSSWLAQAKLTTEAGSDEVAHGSDRSATACSCRVAGVDHRQNGWFWLLCAGVGLAGARRRCAARSPEPRPSRAA
ncbi:MAG TPA: hypothetical protein VFK05_05500 [Polyangiaceae bacterium]|nr:hypothetical protein [Polyangiaceae bacterium]